MFDVDDLETPVLFPVWLEHLDVSNALKYKVLSAGFVTIKNNVVTAFGDSFSLCVKSREIDSQIISYHLSLD